MSTRFTNRGVPLQASQVLQLVQSSAQLNQAAAFYLSQRLLAKGYEAITPSLLSFLGELECGVNYGSDIARKLGVSRQMVAKTVKGLVQLGFLQQVAGEGKQKQILFTERGEHLMSDARQVLAELDTLLEQHYDANALSDLSRQVDDIATLLVNFKQADKKAR